MATVLSHAIISNASEKVDTYVTTATALYDELSGILANLVSANFNGEAADGYHVFYTQKVVPAITENLTAPSTSLMANIKSILESIQTQLLDTVDPELGNNNKSVGTSAE